MKQWDIFLTQWDILHSGTESRKMSPGSSQNGKSLYLEASWRQRRPQNVCVRDDTLRWAWLQGQGRAWERNEQHVQPRTSSELSDRAAESYVGF